MPFPYAQLLKLMNAAPAGDQVVDTPSPWMAQPLERGMLGTYPGGMSEENYGGVQSDRLGMSIGSPTPYTPPTSAQNLGSVPAAKASAQTSTTPQPRRSTGGSQGLKDAVPGAALRPNGGFQPSADFQDLMKQLGQRGSEGLAQQQKGITSLEDQLLALKGQELQTDYSPWLALYDNWYGGNLSKGYQKPLSAQQQNQQAQDLSLAIQKAKNQYTDNDIQLIKDKLGIAERQQESAIRSDDRAYQRQADADKQAAALKARREDLQLQLQMRQDAKDAAADEKKSKLEIEQGHKLLNEPQFKEAAGGIKLQRAASNLERQLDEWGHLPAPVGGEKARYDTLYTQLTTAFKDAEALGALAAADMTLVRQNIANSGGIENYVKNTLTGTNVDTVKDQLKLIRAHAGDVYNNNKKILGSVYKGKSFEDTFKTVDDLYNQADYKSGPKAGDVVDGYRFKGGNPADQNSWEKP